MELESHYRIEILHSFEELCMLLQKVEQQVLVIDAKLPAWFHAPLGLPLEAELSDREQAFGLIQQLEYLNGQNAKEILVGAGIIAASVATLQVIQELNLAKERFKTAIINFKKESLPLNDPYFYEAIDDVLKRRPCYMKAILRKMGLARLHLKQCYRRVPVFWERPEKISWTWANTRSIKRITVAQAEVLLLKKTRDLGIELQLNKLKCLPKDEPLAIVQELAPHLRANVLFTDSTNKTSYRKMVKGLPVFYLYKELLPLPSLRPPGGKKKRDDSKPRRKDVRLEADVFLPAIRAHRYLHERARKMHPITNYSSL